MCLQRGKNCVCSLVLSRAVCVLQDPRVLDSMLPYLTAYYGNPHSRTHAYGWESEAAVEKARRVSRGPPRSRVVFLLARAAGAKRQSKATTIL